MSGGEIFALVWLAFVVALFVWLLRAECGMDTPEGDR